MSAGSRPQWRRDVTVVAGAMLGHPGLLGTGLVTLFRLARRGWWRRAPFLPLPGDDYWRFRLETAFGGSGDTAPLTRGDVVTYLEWCRRASPRRG